MRGLLPFLCFIYLATCDSERYEDIGRGYDKSVKEKEEKEAKERKDRTRSHACVHRGICGIEDSRRPNSAEASCSWNFDVRKFRNTTSQQ